MRRIEGIQFAFEHFKSILLIDLLILNQFQWCAYFQRRHWLHALLEPIFSLAIALYRNQLSSWCPFSICTAWVFFKTKCEGEKSPKSFWFVIFLQRPDIWGDDADQFNPDHFLPERVNQRHPFAFLPFSGGKRNCIGTFVFFEKSLNFGVIFNEFDWHFVKISVLGYQYAIMSIKVVLSKLLRSYKFKTDLQMSDLELKFEVTLKLSNKYPVRVERRNWWFIRGKNRFINAWNYKFLFLLKKIISLITTEQIKVWIQNDWTWNIPRIWFHWKFEHFVW